MVTRSFTLSQPVRRLPTRVIDMTYAAAEFMEESTRIELLMHEAVHRAGQGCGPDFERRLDASLRSLRPMLGDDDFAAATDAIEAAKRVMVSADPSAPLLMLAMARKTLSGVIRRQANTQRQRSAA
jgi:UTP:GlnB (protein PII) uridylyltransferase